MMKKSTIIHEFDITSPHSKNMKLKLLLWKQQDNERKGSSASSLSLCFLQKFDIELSSNMILDVAVWYLIDRLVRKGAIACYLSANSDASTVC